MLNRFAACLFLLLIIAGPVLAQAMTPETPTPAVQTPADDMLTAPVEPAVASPVEADPVMPPAVAPLQDGTAVVTPPADAAAVVVPAPAVSAEDKKTNPGPLRPLLFTSGEYVALQQAKGYRGMVRPVTEGELADSMASSAPKVKPPPEEREIKLGGIVYKSNKNWTIWLNGQRVTPDALPKQALDLKVREDFIEIKWFDEYTNQIFPLRLRAHQRFNIDTRIFLPG